MIVKSLSRKSNGSQLLKYVFRYVLEKNKDMVDVQELKNNKSSLILKHNLRSRSVNGYIREFKENESYRLVRRKDSVILHHTILSFSNRDKEHITDNILKTISKKYVELRGDNCLHLAVKHSDKEHIHCHIVTSGVKLNGRSSRISKQQFKSLKLSLDAFQREKFPFLKNSLPEHGKGTRLTKEALTKMIKAERQTEKLVLIKHLEETYANSISKDDFLSRLKEIGYDTYTRNNKLQGIMIGETKYRFSRLGFDEDLLKEFEKVRGHLQELQHIRKGRNEEIERDNRSETIDKNNVKAEDEPEPKDIDELSDIRDNRNENNIEQEDDDEREPVSTNEDDTGEEDSEE